MHNIDTILFDFDGTLADTFPIIFYAFQTIFKEFNNQNASPEDIIKMFGAPEQEIIKSQFGHHDNITPIINRYYQLYRRAHRQLVKSNLAITRMLDRLIKSGYILAIVTGKGRKSLNISLNELWSDHRFAVTVAGDEIILQKPNPEGILKALSLLDKSPRQAVYVGDSVIDFQAGKAAGLPTFGVRWFNNEIHRYRQTILADFQIDSPDDMLSHFPGPDLTGSYKSKSIGDTRNH